MADYISQAMAGREFCRILGIDYEDILTLRARDREANYAYEYETVELPLWLELLIVPADYGDWSARTLYGRGNIIEGSSDRRWVEAENDSAIFAVIVDWYGLMEAGTADLQYPDPGWRDSDYPDLIPLTPEYVDHLIAEIDADFEQEKKRFPQSTGLGPEFSRLMPHARMALAQAIHRVLKTEVQMGAEAQRRLDAGEALPPAEALPL